ncbi:MAG: YybH family protein [Acidobacteriota bacterium]
MKKIYFFVFMLILCLPSFLYGQGNIDQVKSKIKQMNEQWANYDKTGNYQAVLDFYADDAIVMPPNAKMLRGKDALKSHLEERIKDVERFINEEFNTQDVMGENNLFVEIGTYKQTIQKKNLSNPVNDEGKYVTVWKMMPDGNLKIMVDISNTDTSRKEVQSAEANEKTKDDEVTGGREKK